MNNLVLKKKKKKKKQKKTGKNKKLSDVKLVIAESRKHLVLEPNYPITK